MVDFGYILEKDNTINYDLNDRFIADFVLSKEPSLYKCIQCGTCSGTCSAAAFSDFNFRRMQLLMQRGETKQLKQQISHCMLCGKCQLVCPRGVNTRNVILQIQHALTKKF
jgi:heterodisulfide reductase subunit C